ncbi:MAG: SRPBCC family protein [Halobacteriales archaeon]
MTDDIVIEAAPEEAFAFVDDPANQVAVTPSMLSASVLESHPDGRKRVEYTYKLAGITLSGRARGVERDPPNRLVQSFSGAMEGTVTFRFAAENGATRVTYTAEIDLPEAVFDAAPRSELQSHVEEGARRALSALKEHLEA